MKDLTMLLLRKIIYPFFHFSKVLTGLTAFTSLDLRTGVFPVDCTNFTSQTSKVTVLDLPM